jgi:hypothetical protein
MKQKNSPNWGILNLRLFSSIYAIHEDFNHANMKEVLKGKIFKIELWHTIGALIEKCITSGVLLV